MRWWDSSALLSVLLEQEATADLKELLASDQDIAVWWGTKVESISAVSRLQRERRLEPANANKVVKHLDLLLSSAWEVQPLEEVRVTACRALRVHELRAADSLQLAAALAWCEHRPSGIGFVCLDRSLGEAAMREGFDLLPESR